jgi:hypothetical protein
MKKIAISDVTSCRMIDNTVSNYSAAFIFRIETSSALKMEVVGSYLSIKLLGDIFQKTVIFIFTAVRIPSRVMSSVFWDISHVSHLKISRRFRGRCRLHAQGRISQAQDKCEALSRQSCEDEGSEVTTQRYTPQARTLHYHY